VKTVYAPCRRVLIQQNARGLLPGFMRWVRGVVDCEDVPLNISREVGAPVHVASP
jgi:HSP90 family molecular chaperone